MTKGTSSSSGGQTNHVACRRCGKHAYHIQKHRCASCGFGETSKLRRYNWIRRKK